MKKLKKLSLKELEKEVTCIEYSKLNSFKGGYDDGDCWWRCMAYLKSCGSDFSADAAMSVAREYYGSNFNENSYSFNSNQLNANSYVSDYLTQGTYCPGQVLIFYPDDIPGMSDGCDSEYTQHAVIVKGCNFESGLYELFDPQSGLTFNISADDLHSSNGYFINVQ